VKLRAAETAKSFMIDMWLARQTPEKVLPILHKVLESAKDEFADAVANGGGVYAAGYCFGGKYVMMLAGAPADAESKGRDEEEGMVERGPLIKAGAIAHATLATREDVTAIKAPVSIVCVGKSNNTTPSVLWEIHKANRGDGNTQKTTSYSPKRSSRKEGNISKKTRWTTKSRRIQACHMVS
jgi:dienelactone hydrolase